MSDATTPKAKVRDAQTEAPRSVLFEVFEHRVVGEVLDGGDKSPIEAGFAVCAEAIIENATTDEPVEVEFTWSGMRFVARAELAAPRANPAFLSEDELVAALKERGFNGFVSAIDDPSPPSPRSRRIA